MKRRYFLKTAGLGAAATAGAATIAAPAIAQSMPSVKWRMASSFPKSLDAVYGGGTHVAKRVAEATDGRFEIRVFASGEIVPALQVLDAVQNGTVECGHSTSSFYIGKDPTFAFDSAVPFGLNFRQQSAWMQQGGGMELMRELFKDYNVVQFPAGTATAQMAGWYRKEIKTVQDLAGLKMRIAGLAGQVVAKLGVVPQQIAGSDIYPALEKGTIDAAEWNGPYDDEKLGFYKVAKYYYYPGWWEGGTQITLMANQQAWESLPKHYQSALETACADATLWMQGKYDAENMKALKRLVANGAQLRPFSREVLQACYGASVEVMDEIAATNPRFKKVYENWKTFRDEEIMWFRVAEQSFDNFMASVSARRS
jgi:TRAP-type mannitol/chloroaromatic compound transport system substrate-binding protein